MELINQIIGLLTGFIIWTITTTGYGGVLLLMLAESALIPIPSEVTMPFAGYLASQGVFQFWLVVFAGTFGNLVGSLLAYFIGYFKGDTTVRFLIHKWGKFILVDIHDFNVSEKWFRKYGDRIVFISRLLPVIRTFISLPAGIARMNIWKFVIYTIAGSLFWSILLTAIGYKMGENWHSLEKYYRKFEIVIVVAGMLFVVWYIRHKIKRLRNRNNEIRKLGN